MSHFLNGCRIFARCLMPTRLKSANFWRGSHFGCRRVPETLLQKQCALKPPFSTSSSHNPPSASPPVRLPLLQLTTHPPPPPANRNQPPPLPPHTHQPEEMIRATTCTRRVPARPATVLPPRALPRMNGSAMALVSSLAHKCPEAVYCVVAPLVLGCVLVFNGFQSYNKDRLTRRRM